MVGLSVAWSSDILRVVEIRNEIREMKVSVKLIATYQKYLPPGAKGNVYETEVPAGTGAEDLLARFDVPTDSASVVLINGRTPDQNYILKEGDVVCAFPAVGGG